MQPCKMRTQNCLFFRNSIVELMVIKTTCKGCHIWILLFQCGSTLTKIWELFEIMTLFMQRIPVIFVCDSVELRIRNSEK